MDGFDRSADGHHSWVCVQRSVEMGETAIGEVTPKTCRSASHPISVVPKEVAELRFLPVS
jgi:hypothetical protein